MANNSPHSESLSVAPANSLSELGLNFYPIVPQRLREVYNMGSDDLHKSSSSEWDRVQNVVQRINDAGSQVNSEHGSNEKHGGGIHLLPFP